MRLFITRTSPYARIVRILIHEKNIADRVEVVVARTRTPGSPYYGIVPSGRVPCLVLDDGRALEGTALICDYLDRLDDAPAFAVPGGDAGWEHRRLEMLAYSLLDGLAVWLRELYRPEEERSPTILAHEQARAGRLADLWQREIANPVMQGALAMPQIVLAAALQLDARLTGLDWREGHPALAAWLDRLAARPSLAETLAA